MKKPDKREKMMADRWLETGNKKQSAIDAGYAYTTAHSKAGEILARPYVAEYIRQQQREKIQLLVTKEGILLDLIDIARADPIDVMDVVDGQLTCKNLAEVPIGTRRAISSIKQGAHGLDIRLAGKQQAFELLCKLAGLLNEEIKPEAEKAVQIIDDV